MDINKKTILEQLEKILSHSSFANSKVNGRLLSFLVHASLNDEYIKEAVIGNEIFGSFYDPLESGSKVRVYIFNLRKKLDEYYSESSDKNQIVFSIDKGQYHVRFSKANNTKAPLSKKRKTIIMAIMGLLIGTLSLIIFFNEDKPEFWNDIINSNFSTTVLFGDLYTLDGKTITGEIGITRDFSINSVDDFKDYLKRNPHMADSLKSGAYQYLTRFAPYCSKKITRYFSRYDLDFQVKLLSEWDRTNLQKENVIYFGQSKTMGLLKNVLNESFPQYEFNNASIIRSNSIDGNHSTFTDVVSRGGKITDYTVVASLTTQSGNSLKFFLSDQDCGAISAINYFTNNDSIKAFYDRHKLGLNTDFIALFKVEGWERKGYQMEFILIDKNTN